jgi:hypothetical protein
MKRPWRTPAAAFSLLSNARGVMDALIGGWSLNGDFHYNTGTPISVHSTNSIPGFNSIYVDLVPGCNLTSGSRKLNHTWLAEVRHEISISGYLPCPQATSSFCSRVVFENAM